MSIQTAVSNSTRRFTQLETWTWGLLNAIIMGGSSSVVSWLGMAAAKGVGLDVPSLNFKAVGVIFLSGALVKFFAYLSQGLPALTQTTESAHYVKSADGSVVAESSRTTITTPADGAKSGLTTPVNQPTVDSPVQTPPQKI